MWGASLSPTHPPTLEVGCLTLLYLTTPPSLLRLPTRTMHRSMTTSSLMSNPLSGRRTRARSPDQQTSPAGCRSTSRSLVTGSETAPILHLQTASSRYLLGKRRRKVPVWRAPSPSFVTQSELEDRRAVVVDVDVTHVPLERRAAGVHVEIPMHHLLHPLEGLEVLVYSRTELELVLQQPGRGGREDESERGGKTNHTTQDGKEGKEGGKGEGARRRRKALILMHGRRKSSE